MLYSTARVTDSWVK